jgi:integrin alpha FG-GAP repeat containing protein 1
MEIALQVRPQNKCITDPRLTLKLDIFIVCDDSHTGNKIFQIWVNNKDSGFSLAQTGPLPSGVQAISFADVGMFFFISL